MAKDDAPKTTDTATTPPTKGKTVTVVINNMEAIQCFQMPNVGKDTAGTPMLGNTIVLSPGVNLVPTDDLNGLLTNPTVKERFESTIPRGLAPESNPEKFGLPFLVKGHELPMKHPLLALHETEAQAVIKETLIEKLLRDWQREEIRGDVRRSIQEQMDFLAGGQYGGPAAHAGKA